MNTGPEATRGQGQARLRTRAMVMALVAAALLEIAGGVFGGPSGRLFVYAGAAVAAVVAISRGLWWMIGG